MLQSVRHAFIIKQMSSVPIFVAPTKHLWWKFALALLCDVQKGNHKILRGVSDVAIQGASKVTTLFTLK